jgi:hypothetical protein
MPFIHLIIQVFFNARPYLYAEHAQMWDRIACTELVEAEPVGVGVVLVKGVWEGYGKRKRH